MFVLAHLSDPHLAPLPQPRLSELDRQARDRLSQLAAQAAADPPRRRARAHRRRPQGAGAGPHRGDRRSRQHLARRRISRRRAPGSKRSARRADVTLVPGNHDAYVRSGRAASAAALGRLHARRRRRRRRFPFLRRRGPLALIGLSSAVPTAPLMATGRLGADQLQRLGDAARSLRATKDCSASC